MDERELLVKLATTLTEEEFEFLAVKLATTPPPAAPAATRTWGAAAAETAGHMARPVNYVANKALDGASYLHGKALEGAGYVGNRVHEGLEGQRADRVVKGENGAADTTAPGRLSGLSNEAIDRLSTLATAGTLGAEGAAGLGAVYLGAKGLGAAKDAVFGDDDDNPHKRHIRKRSSVEDVALKAMVRAYLEDAGVI